MSTSPDITWNQLAKLMPWFVQWIVQRHGPLPDGIVSEEDYMRYREEYLLECPEGSGQDGTGQKRS